jgi:Ca2+-binding EF-hand superfamily protein
MVTVLGTVYGLEGISQVEATERVEFIFKLLDTNGDEEISEEEFIRGCLEDQELVKLLQP